jgi:hypothetical protein
MRGAFFRDYLQGISIEYIAINIGVARSTLDKFMDSLELPRGRWVSLEQRRAAVFAMQVRGEIK